MILYTIAAAVNGYENMETERVCVRQDLCQNQFGSGGSVFCRCNCCCGCLVLFVVAPGGAAVLVIAV